jgi:transposase-like protein
MKRSTGFPRHRFRRTQADRRAQLLAAFDRSGLSAAAFARQHSLNYTTFCGWRQRRSQAKALPAFVQVELPAPAAPAELLIEPNGRARMRITSVSQVELAARLLQSLQATAPC